MMRIIKGKKGFQMISEYLVKIIIVALAFVIIFMIFTSLLSKTDQNTKDAACRASVLLRDKANVKIIDGIWEENKITPLTCPAENLHQLSSDRVKAETTIATAAARCWWRFANGAVTNLFDKEADRKGCMVCAEFSLSPNMDKGVQPALQIYTEPPHEHDRIYMAELMNFFANNIYNSPIFYGGRGLNYFGDIATFTHDYRIKHPVERKTNEIIGAPIASYVRDYSYRLTNDTKSKIDEMGRTLNKNNKGNLLVLVADKFESNSRGDAIKIMESLNMNSKPNQYDAILVMVDVSNRSVRIIMGRDLDYMVKEVDVSAILKTSLDKFNAGDVNGGTLDVVTNLYNKLNGFQQNALVSREGFKTNSYYYYLSNGFKSMPFSQDLQSGYTYYIAFVSDSNKIGLWAKIGGSLIWAGYDKSIALSGTFPEAFVNYFKMASAFEKVSKNYLLIAREDIIGDRCYIQ